MRLYISRSQEADYAPWHAMTPRRTALRVFACFPAGVLEFAPRGFPAPQVPLGKVAFEHAPHLGRQCRVDRRQPVRHVFMHRGFCHAENFRRRAHRRARSDYVLPERRRPIPAILCHSPIYEKIRQNMTDFSL